MNDKIRAREVSVIDQTGASLGVLSLRDALDAAAARGVDLVEVNPTANPPVCKLLDYGRFQFEQSKRQREASKAQKNFVLKEIRFRPNVGEHDVETKMKNIREFLNAGDKVKVVVRLRGRELAHPERAGMLLDTLAEQLKPHTVERPSQADMRTRTMIVSPAKAVKATT
ncbi:MAG: translation initiation factor IF-3 [Chloroflexota bacterium]